MIKQIKLTQKVKWRTFESKLKFTNLLRNFINNNNNAEASIRPCNRTAGGKIKFNKLQLHKPKTTLWLATQQHTNLYPTNIVRTE